MITTIFFDIGNVLLDFHGPTILEQVALKVGRTPKEVTEFFWHSKVGERLEVGEIRGEQVFTEFRAGLGFSGTYEQFESLWCEHFQLNQDTAALLEALAKTHKVYLLSNTNHVHYEYFLKRYAFTRQVHGAVLSHEVKMRKPEPRIYKEALRLASAKASESFFTDDLAENIEAAQAEGLHGHRFTGVPALKAELHRLSIL